MTVKQIIRKHLADNGYDGLYNMRKLVSSPRRFVCECSLEDLMSCEQGCSGCVPAYKHKSGSMHSMKESDFEELKKRGIIV